MTTGVLATPPILPFTFNNGQPAAGGSILTQIGGVNAATYQDSALTTPLPNPIPLNSRGEVSDSNGNSQQLFLTPNQTYTFTLFDANGNQIWSATYVNGVQFQVTAAAVNAVSSAASILASLNQTTAEIAAGVTPTTYAYPPGNALRYGVDPTGVNDSTVPIQNWINACWAMYQYQDGQGLWNGSAGAAPVLQLPPGKFRVTNTMYLPSGCTFRGTGHPAHTVNHTRIIMDSTGVVPPTSWSSNGAWDAGDIIQVGNGFWFFCMVGGAGGASAPAWPTTVGAQVTDGAATWQNFGAVGSAGTDNRNKPMFKFRRGTLPGVGPGPGGTLQNAGCASTIQELEFWFVAPGDLFTNPLGASGATGNQRSYPQGATFALDVDCTDMRFIDCVFQNSPCSLWMSGVSTATATRGDGFPGNRGINIFVENCEFDAASAHIWASGCFLQNTFKNCQFFNTPQYIYNCTGKMVYQACYFQDGEILDYGVGISTGGASPAVNSMTSLSILGCEIEPPINYYFLSASGINLVNVAANSFLTPATRGGIYLQNSIGGAISGNTFDSQGANVPAGSGFSDFHGCVKLDGCKNMLVSNNNFTATFSATYGGFGILTGTSTATTSTNNFIQGNAINVAYNGAGFNGQARSINVASGDVRGVNLDNRLGTATPAGGSLTLSGTITAGTQTTGFGTPTGNVVIANYPGASATLLQTSETVAAILVALKNAGLIGA